MSIKLHLDSEAEILRRLNLESGGAVQAALDNSIVRTTDPYVPMDSGALAQTVRGMGSGQIEYIMPYAHYLYTGLLRTDEAGRTFVGLGESKPVLTGVPLNFNTEKHPLAGPQWFERSKADNKDTWIKEAKAAVGK